MNGTDTNDTGQERGGQGSGHNSARVDIPTVETTVITPTQLFIAKNCNGFDFADAYDTCYDMA